MSTANKVRLHLPDGAAQRTRGEEFASGADDLFFSASEWLYYHDPTTLAPGG